MSKIDVSKCAFYNETSFCMAYTNCYGDWLYGCSDLALNNCYYKQLQQLKQKNDELKKLNKMLAENNAVQQWADMYNKKDKDHFDCQLKLALAEQKLEKIKEKTIKLRTFNSYHSIDEVNDDLDFILEIIESEEDESK